MKLSFFICFLFLTACSSSTAQHGLDVEADKIFESCLRENNSSSCTAGCGLIIQSCHERRSLFIKERNSKTAKSVSVTEFPSTPREEKNQEENARHASQSIYHHRSLGVCKKSEVDIIAGIISEAAGGQAAQSYDSRKVAKEATWLIFYNEGMQKRWHLIERVDGRYCNTLYIPFANDANLINIDGILSIEARAESKADDALYNMIFRRSTKLGIYVPYRCTKTNFSADSKAATTRTIDCLTVPHE